MILTRIFLVLAVSILVACAPKPLAASQTFSGENTSIPTHIPSKPEMTPRATALPVLGEVGFDAILIQAVQARDLAKLRQLMRTRFSIVTFEESLVEINAEDAITLLDSKYLSAGSMPQIHSNTDIPVLMNGRDPLAEWGPVANPVRALYVTGLGSDASSEAILVIGQDPSSERFYFHGLLVPRQDRFEIDYASPATVQPTGIQTLRALVDVNLRAGPGVEYEIVGLLNAGTTAQVSGVSPGGSWWRVFCQELSSGLCWVSADPTLTSTDTP